MNDEQLLRCEESLDIYDRTHHNPAYVDHRDPVSVTARALLAEVRRLRGLLREVASTFDGADPVGPPLRDEIRAALAAAGRGAS